MEIFLSPDIWAAFLTLTALEIVLGIDNVIFISILTNQVDEKHRARVRTIGLSLAMLMRIALLLSLAWIMGLTKDLFVLFEFGISGRDILLILGGLFLLGKATREIHNSLEVVQPQAAPSVASMGFYAVLLQIVVIDLVFSFDSVITAVGLVDQVPVMIAAIVVAIIVMIFASGAISRYVESHPTMKILALAFLLLIGLALVLEGVDVHLPKGYIYFAMLFAFLVELLNLRGRGGEPPVKLRRAQLGDLMPVEHA